MYSEVEAQGILLCHTEIQLYIIIVQLTCTMMPCHNQTLGSVFPTTSRLLYYAARVYFIHPRVYKFLEYMGVCTSYLSFEMWVHYSKNYTLCWPF